MTVQYKVWAHVERCDEEADEYVDLGLPTEVGCFDTEDEAFVFVDALPKKEA